MSIPYSVATADTPVTKVLENQITIVQKSIECYAHARKVMRVGVLTIPATV